MFGAVERLRFPSLEEGEDVKRQSQRYNGKRSRLGCDILYAPKATSHPREHFLPG